MEEEKPPPLDYARPGSTRPNLQSSRGPFDSLAIFLFIAVLMVLFLSCVVGPLLGYFAR